MTVDPKRKVTVVQLARLGDLCQTWRLINSLLWRYGVGQVALAVNSGLRDIAGLMVGNDNVIAVPIQQILSGFSEQYQDTRRSVDTLKQLVHSAAAEAVINLNYSAPVASLAEAIPAGHHFGARWRDVRMGVPSDLQLEKLFNAASGLRTGTEHISDIWDEYAFIGTDRSEVEFGFEAIKLDEVSQSTGMKLLSDAGISKGTRPIVLIPGAGLEARQWGVHKFSRVADVLSSLAPVMLTGTKHESELAEQIVKSIRGTAYPVISLCGKTTPLELVSVLKISQLVIGVDTGALNLACALGTRCLGIYYGSMNYAETGPYSDGNYVIAPDRDDYPCQEWEMERNPARFADDVPIQCVIDTANSIITRHDIEQYKDVRIFRSNVASEGIHWQQVYEQTEIREAV